MRIQSHNTLLIVDDIPANVSVLFDFLTTCGFKVLVAQDGESALQKAQYALPNLILLDVMMPGIDGFETCQRLKSNPKTQDIPVIFMTALADTENKVKGFGLGAVDYVTKPIQQEEVLARVNTHLTLRKLQKELQTQNQELDAFAHTVAHDLKNPLNAVLGFSDLLIETAPKLEPEADGYLKNIQKGAHKMLDIIEALLLLAGVSKQEVQMQPLSMDAIVHQVRDRLAFMLKNYEAEIILPEEWPVVRGYAPWVEEIWANYINNALKYGGHPPRVELGSRKGSNKKIQFWVRDNGEGLTPEQQATLFTPFTRLNEHRAKGHGLGLSIVQRIAEKLGGEVGVESTVGQGSLFYFSLPAA